jgi:teichuronic acid biosynthesis glycosyltransferase TuaH
MRPSALRQSSRALDECRCMKKRILYFMHVDWGWIKQRPHFLAEGLSAVFEVLVVHPRANRRSQLSLNETTLSRVPIWAIPFARLKALSLLNTWIRTIYLRVLLLAYRPSVVWLTFPTVVPTSALRRLSGSMVVYDCMDDAPEFRSKESERRQIQMAEQALLECADLILVSSENLRGKILGRGAAADKVMLVRNAFGGIVQPEQGARRGAATPVGVLRILYFGTIGGYLDFDVLLHCLDMVEGVEFHFFGPVMVDLPAHPGLKFHGTVEHDSLAARAQEFDCLVMPFVVNELIQGVDPVKLYEYVNLGKNILCPYYPEIDRFSAFVSFYRSREEFVAAVRKLIKQNDRQYDMEQRRLFLDANSWPVRAAEVIRRIDRCLQIKALKSPPEI